MGAEDTQLLFERSNQPAARAPLIDASTSAAQHACGERESPHTSRSGIVEF
jgi:hypothetical protein